MSTTEERLRALGDPSGKQTAEYWDEWFRAVSAEGSGRDENSTSAAAASSGSPRTRPFEWYASAEEVGGVLSSYLRLLSDDGRAPRVVHPGSGNSLLPLHLRDVALPGSDHVVLDVSPVALEEIRRTAIDRDRDAPSRPDRGGSVEYALADILEPPLPYPDGSFDAWVDKGLLDALFSSSGDGNWGSGGAEADDDGKKCSLMLEEARRILRDGGIAMIVSMAEDHSLRLILSNWMFGGGDVNHRWESRLRVHELEPTSGRMRPFGFFLENSRRAVVGGGADRDEGAERVVELRSRTGEVERIDVGAVSGPVDGVNSEEEGAAFGLWFDAVKGALERSRAAFAREVDETEERRALEAAISIGGGRGGEGGGDRPQHRRLVLAALDVKPADDEVNLSALHGRITSPMPPSPGGQYFPSLRWYDGDTSGDSNNNFDNDAAGKGAKPVLRYGRIVPIGFGICKLVLRCIVEADEIEDLCEEILRREEEQGSDAIMSVDIDWTETVPVGNPGGGLGQ